MENNEAASFKSLDDLITTDIQKKIEKKKIKVEPFTATCYIFRYWNYG